MDLMVHRPTEDAAIANIEFEQRLLKDVLAGNLTPQDMILWDEDRDGYTRRVIAAKHGLSMGFVIRRLKLVTAALLLIERGYLDVTKGVRLGSG